MTHYDAIKPLNTSGGGGGGPHLNYAPFWHQNLKRWPSRTAHLRPARRARLAPAPRRHACGRSPPAPKTSRKRPATNQGEDDGRAKAPGPKGANHVTAFNDTRREQVKAHYDTHPKEHIMIDPPAKIPYQVCYYMHTKHEYEGRAPQTMARLFCEHCNHACCSPTCWNLMHGIKPHKRAP